MGGTGEHAKRNAAWASLSFNLLSTVVKIIAAILTGSVSLLSEAVHSTTDVIASTMAFFSVRAAAAPPDEEHPYGHGKMESLAGFGESVMLLLIVVYILVESIRKLRFGGNVEKLDFGMLVMALSSLGALATGLFVGKVGRDSDSLALKSNGQHLMVDAVTSAGVFAALGITAITGWWQADAVVAMLLAIWIALNSWRLAKAAFDQLVDRSLPPEQLERLRTLLESQDSILDFHRLRSRVAGNERYIDLHIVVPNTWTVVHAHDVADRLEKLICQEFAPAHVVIHVDPFDEKKVASRSRKTGKFME